MSADVRIALVYCRSPRELYNGGPADAVFPGFFVDAYRNEGYERLMPVRQIAPEVALDLAQTLDSILKDTNLAAAVRRASEDAVGELERKIELARGWAERLPELERQLAEQRRAR